MPTCCDPYETPPDRPHPGLEDFIRRHLTQRPCDPNVDAYDVPAFGAAIRTTKSSPIYRMHTYWSKKPYDAVRDYIRHYTAPGDLVLDPFCGSGSTALAALMEGRKAVALDRSPAAVFITRQTCAPPDPAAFAAAFDQVARAVAPEMDRLYGTVCDRCGGKALTRFTVYSQTFQCPRCLNRVPLYACIDATLHGRGGQKRIRACPHCHDNGHAEEIRTSGKHFGAAPVMAAYECLGGCIPKYGSREAGDGDPKKRRLFETADAAKIREIAEKDIPHPYPDPPLEALIPYRMKHKKDFRPEDAHTLSDLFTRRNLWALAAWRRAMERAPEKMREPLSMVFTAGVFAGSRLQQYHRGGGGFQRGTYYIPPVHMERNVHLCILRKFRDVARGWADIAASVSAPDFLCSCQSATSLHQIPPDAVDYIFTDPPYADKIQYGELNAVWEVWLGLDRTWTSDEVIVNPAAGKTLADWTRAMTAVMAECHRILKPGRWLSLCYHDASEGTWALIQDVMAAAGFLPDDSARTLYIETAEKSSNQRTADKVTQRDLVINFYKPPSVVQIPGTSSADAAAPRPTFREAVLSLIREYLVSHPGAARDRIWDAVASRMVRSGRLEPFDFDAWLREIAEPAVWPPEADAPPGGEKRAPARRQSWHLIDAADRVDETETRLEDRSARSLEAFMTDHLARNPDQAGVHYSLLFEQYLGLSRKPARQLADWLPDYFCKTPEGTWRPPADAQEREKKRRQRKTGALRRIKAYARRLEQGLSVPGRLRPESDAVIADWLRRARRNGLYRQGRIIFEKSGFNLSRLEVLDEHLAMDAHEDYQVCVKRDA